ncbi:MAG: chorismate mutase [Chloroflexi bacterium]|nr:chorismate mutase [Chloroflexota bacterium]
MGMRFRGIRGATTVELNDPDAIREATTVLLTEMMRANDLRVDDVASAFFTTTRDLTAEFPAVAANKMGFTDVALMCGHEMEVPGSLPMCLRILLHVNTEKDADQLIHTYQRGAKALRPDRNYSHVESTEANSP